MLQALINACALAGWCVVTLFLATTPFDEALPPNAMHLVLALEVCGPNRSPKQRDSHLLS